MVMKFIVKIYIQNLKMFQFTKIAYQSPYGKEFRGN